MFCWNCGNRLDDDANFCPLCGSKVIRDDEPAAPAAPVVPVAPVAPAAPSQNYSNQPNYYNQANYSNQPNYNNQPNYSNQNNYNNQVNYSNQPNYNNQANNNQANYTNQPNYNNQANYSNQNNYSANTNNNYANNAYSANKTTAKSSTYSQNTEQPTEDYSGKKINPDTIGKFAPLTSFLPIAIAIISAILSALARAFHNNPVGDVSNIIRIILQTLMCLATLVATGGLAYSIVKKNKVSAIYAWTLPIGTFFAFMACWGISGNWKGAPVIFTILALALGLEYVARILIAKQPMDTPINLGADINAYKQFFKEYKEKNPSSKELEQAEVLNVEASKFDGKGIELLGYSLLAGLVSTITCGIAAPWMICKIYRWRLGHTVINGKRLTFTGTGGSLFGHWLLWELLTIITCGIYSFFLYVALRKWELQNTYIEGEPIVANGNESYFDGGSGAVFGYGLLFGLLLPITCGISFPWLMSMFQKWDTKHQVINGRRLVFSGSGLGFLGEFIIISLLSLITCGIYSSWGIVRMNKYIIRHTDFAN